MTALAALPALRLPRAVRRRYPGWSVALSVLVHVALLALFIIAAEHQRRLPEAVPPAPVAMVFEGGGKTPPSIANPGPGKPNLPGSPQQQPAVPPTSAPAPATPPVPPTPVPAPGPPPQATPVNPAAPPEQSQPGPNATRAVAPPVAPPTQQPVAPALTPPIQERPVPPTPAVPPQPMPAPQPPAQAGPQPMPIQPVPEVQIPAEQLAAPQTLPLPPPPPTPLPHAALPRAMAPAQSRAGPAFPAPMDFSLGSNALTASTTPSPPRHRPSAGTMDLSFSSTLGAGDITQLHAHGKGDTVGADWFNEVSAWWIRHRFYPNEAARLAQDGDVTLRLVVAPSGHVESLELAQGSGSPWLDMGAEAVFRGATLPPLPGNIQDPNITVNFTIHYEIVR